MRNKGSGFSGFYRFKGGDAAHKNQKRRRILIALRAVVISSEVEKSSLQAGIRRACENRNRQHQDVVSVEVHV